MCGHIKKLRFADRRAEDEEVKKAAIQYVRKITAYRNPSDENKQAFDQAVKSVSKSLIKMLDTLSGRELTVVKTKA